MTPADTPDLSQISVVLLTRNCLSQLVDNLPRMQKWLPTVGELIIVDAESTDGSREFLQRQLRGETVQLISTEAESCYGWNVGINATSKAYIHLSVPGNPISVADLGVLQTSIGPNDVVCSPPSFVNLAGDAVIAERWPIHELLERHAGMAEVELSGWPLAVFAMEFCRPPLSEQGWLGSLSSALFRSSALEQMPLPTDCGRASDLMFGLRYARQISAKFLRQSCGQYAYCPKPSEDFAAVFAEQYAKLHAALVDELPGLLATKALTPAMEPSLWRALSFDSLAVHDLVSQYRLEVADGRAKVQKLREQVRARKLKLEGNFQVMANYFKQRLQQKGLGPFKTWVLKRERRHLEQSKLKLESTPPPPNVVTVEGRHVQDATLIVTAAEINDRHGTGVLLERIFKGDLNFIHVRCMNLYGGKTQGALRVFLPSGTDSSIATAALKGSTLRHVLSVPYSASDVHNTLALCADPSIPLCVWLMDHHLGSGEHQIPPSLMKQLLDRAKLRLGISPEFCGLYEQMFGHDIHFAPPIVDSALAQVSPLQPHSSANSTGALLGNLWSQQWLKKLAATVEGAEISLTAFGHQSPEWVKHGALESSVRFRGFLPEEELVAALRGHAYAVVPTGTMDEEDDLPEIARYSLPSRTLYLSAVGNLPIIVTGHAESGVAKFVKRYDLGVVVPYEGEALRQMVQWICRPEQQLRFRRRAAAMAPAFACDDGLDWLWRSLEMGRPCDERWSEAALSANSL